MADIKTESPEECYRAWKEELLGLFLKLSQGHETGMEADAML